MFYVKRAGKELDDKQYQRIIADTVREKLNWEEPSEQKEEEESSADEEEVEQNAEEQSDEEEQEAQEEPKKVERDPLTGLTVGQICKVSDNLEMIIRKGLKSRFGYLMNLDYKINPGDGAFYGPKIDIHVKDCIGREWQCGTIQLDMQLPKRFNLTYVDENGEVSEKKKLYFLRRLLPFVEKRVNLIELAPKGTGKSYVFEKISKRGWLYYK